MSSANPAIPSLRRPLPPLEFVLPATRADVANVKRRRSLRGVLAGLAMYATAIWMAVDNVAFRHAEAKLITPIAGSVVGNHGAVNSHALVYFALGTPRAFGLQITNECTSALLLIPLLVMMGSFAAFTGLGLARELVALFVGAAIIVAVNAARVTGIAYATWRWGFNPGYNYSHVFVGSAFSLIGFVGAMLTALWILVRGDRNSVRRLVAHGVPAGTGALTIRPGALRRILTVLTLAVIAACCVAMIVSQMVIFPLILAIANVVLLAAAQVFINRGHSE